MTGRIGRESRFSRWTLACLAVVAVLAAGCGGGDDSGEQSGSAASSAESSMVAEAERFLAENTPEVREDALSTEPVKPPRGQNVWVISCGQTGQSCFNLAAGASAAVEALAPLGWEVTVFDAQLNVSRYNQGIRQALVDGADAIILMGIDCSSVKGSVALANRKDVPVVAASGFNCDHPTQGGGDPLYAYTIPYGPLGSTLSDTEELTGRLQAAWAIAHVEEPKALEFVNPEYAPWDVTFQGFESYFGECSECEIAGTPEWLLEDLGGALTQKANNAILRNPEANVLVAPLDTAAALIAQAVVNSGKTGSVVVLGAGGDEKVIEMIRSGRGMAMTVAQDFRWAGWITVDVVIRTLRGEEPVDSGFALGVIDEDNLPESERYEAPVDYQALYRKLWGVA